MVCSVDENVQSGWLSAMTNDEIIDCIQSDRRKLIEEIVLEARMLVGSTCSTF